MMKLCVFLQKNTVAPLAGAWIEISSIASPTINVNVAPLAGAWIEIISGGSDSDIMMSHPSRVRGLKYYLLFCHYYSYKVAPLAGAWIEISAIFFWSMMRAVAPLAGAWIEIRFPMAFSL